MFRTVKSIQTKEGNTVNLLESQNKEYDKTILIIGVFHGEEPQGEYLINRFIKTDLSGAVKNSDASCMQKQGCGNSYIIKNKLFIIPCLNPDGKNKNQRQNANGVDLNRNFPTKNWKLTDKAEYFGGMEPASEIETKFMIKILETYHFDAILSIHAPFRIVNYDGPAKGLAEKISSLTGYPVQGDIGYPTPGSFGNYAGVERKIPVITLELPENETNEELWNTNKTVFDYLACEF